jgi:hypothetical protein
VFIGVSDGVRDKPDTIPVDVSRFEFPSQAPLLQFAPAGRSLGLEPPK